MTPYSTLSVTHISIIKLLLWFYILQSTFFKCVIISVELKGHLIASVQKN